MKTSDHYLDESDHRPMPNEEIMLRKISGKGKAASKESITTTNESLIRQQTPTKKEPLPKIEDIQTPDEDI